MDQFDSQLVHDRDMFRGIFDAIVAEANIKLALPTQQEIWRIIDIGFSPRIAGIIDTEGKGRFLKQVEMIRNNLIQLCNEEDSLGDYKERVRLVEVLGTHTYAFESYNEMSQSEKQRKGEHGISSRN